MFQRSFIVTFVLGFAIPALAQAEGVTPLFRTDVGDLTNQEIVFLEVTYPPGASSASHRHDAHTIVYVLEGTVIMQVKDGEEKTLSAGEVFYETPEDVHSVSRNASETEPAKILVWFLKEKGAPTTRPAT